MSDGIFDKYELINELISEIDKIADSRGIQRAALLVSVTQALVKLRDGLKQDEESTKAQIEAMKTHIANLEKEGG